MHTIMDLCFLCTNEYNCVMADERIITQVEYLLPEITIIKLGIPLRICSVCDGALCALSKFKQSSVESSRRLEARIKGAQGPPLHTGSPPVVDDNETSGAKPEKRDETSIKEEYVEETPLDTQMHTNRTFLNPIPLSETFSSVPHNQLHKVRMSHNIKLHTDTNAENKEEISIKEEHIEETPQDREFYNILKKECVSNSKNEDTNLQPEHNTEYENLTLNTNEEVWEESSTGSEETVDEFDGDWSKNTQIDSLSCSICNKKFKNKYARNRHIKIHCGVKDFRCEICEKSFTQKSSLTNHLKIHSGVKEFQCEICEKIFMRKAYLNLHMKIHSRVRDFRCEICEKSFSQKSSLTIHMKIHSTVKEFQCEICDKSFAFRNSFMFHMKLHSDIGKRLSV